LPLDAHLLALHAGLLPLDAHLLALDAGLLALHAHLLALLMLHHGEGLAVAAPMALE
jgi:hypothetical protein